MWGLLETVTVGQEKLLARTRAKQLLLRRKQVEVFLSMSLIVYKLIQAILPNLCHGLSYSKKTKLLIETGMD
jgi:hypothetical protein